MKHHQTTIGKSDRWLTPPEILEPLGEFDLDPCADLENPTNVNAKSHYITKGLEAPWFGRVWCNPPFNRNERPRWMAAMALHDNGIMLVPAACETEAFFKYVWGRCSAVLMLKGRPHFHYPSGERANANSGCTICLVAYGENNATVLERSGLGVLLRVSS